MTARAAAPTAASDQSPMPFASPPQSTGVRKPESKTVRGGSQTETAEGGALGTHSQYSVQGGGRASNGQSRGDNTRFTTHTAFFPSWSGVSNLSSPRKEIRRILKVGTVRPQLNTIHIYYTIFISKTQAKSMISRHYLRLIYKSNARSFRYLLFRGVFLLFFWQVYLSIRP